MAEGKLGAVESRFADIVWAHAPLASRELARLCEQELGWKRTTTYNVLRKLCERGLFQNDGGTVRGARLARGVLLLTGRGAGRFGVRRSLPAFLAAFTKRRALSRSEIEKIQKMIDEAEA